MKYTDKNHGVIVKSILFIVAVSLLMVVFVWKFDGFLEYVEEITSVLSPVIWGCVIAFLLNPLMKTLEKLMTKYIFKKNPHKKLQRFISIFITCTFFVAVVTGLLYVVVPEIIDSIIAIFDNISVWVDQITKWVQHLFRNNQEIQDKIVSKIYTYSNDISTLIETFKPILNNIQSGAIGFISFVKNFLLGFIVSVYILASKENLLAQGKKTILAIFQKKTCEKIFSILSQINRVFSGFITGKIIDSAIIGVITFVSMTILDFPYIIMISVIVGVTNIIPFFGPFIGAIPSAMLILLSTSSFKEVLIFAIMILIIQQLDGNVIGPSILGNSTGLPAIWILISLLVGGGLFGFVGMVLAVPTFAVIYDLSRSAVANKLRTKMLPPETDAYLGDIQHFYKRNTKTERPLSAEELEQIEIPPSDQTNEANKKNF